jgi:hypothetical protein
MLYRKADWRCARTDVRQLSKAAHERTSRQVRVGSDSTRLKVSTKSQVIPQQPTFERTSLFVVQGHNRTDIKPSALAALK